MSTVPARPHYASGAAGRMARVEGGSVGGSEISAWKIATTSRFDGADGRPMEVGLFTTVGPSSKQSRRQ